MLNLNSWSYYQLIYLLCLYYSEFITLWLLDQIFMNNLMLNKQFLLCKNSEHAKKIIIPNILSSVIRTADFFAILG